jgi:hypothetical protein
MKLSYEWLAGFFEGEGSIGCYRRKCGKYRSYSFKLSFAQNEKQILNKIKSYLGTGSISVLYPKYKSHYGGKVFTLVVSNSHALSLANTLLPYLQTDKKKKQVMQAITTLAAMRKRKGPIVPRKGG